MTYDYAINKIKQIENFGSKPGLERIKKLMNFVGNPQNYLKCIHVAGTNGKGSVCFALEAILRAEGYKTGLYISPSISNFCERISVNGENIDKKSLTGIFEYFEQQIKKDVFKNDPVTEFELTTAMAFKFFYDNSCDIAIIETGMGGKLDATNIINKPVCSVLTSISLDHTKILGNTVEKIAGEKCGIIKPDCPVIICDEQPEEVYNIAKKTSCENCSELHIALKSELKSQKNNALNGISFTYHGQKIDTPVMGNHQFINLSCALKTLETIKNDFPVQNKTIRKALKTLKIPCRLEVVSENPIIILDSAHNPKGTEALANFLRQNCKNKKIHGIVGMFKDKDYETSLKNISGIFETIYTISPQNKRAETLEKITKCAQKYCKNVISCGNIKTAIKEATMNTSPQDIIVIFGSFSVMKDFKKLNLWT